MNDYWWNAYKYGGEILRLKPAEAAMVMQAKQRGEPVLVKRLSMMIDTKELAEIEKTDEPIRDLGLQAIGDGTTGARKKELPIGYPESAQARYVKRKVPFRAWERKYAPAPGYHLLHSDDDDEGTVWVCMTRIVTPSERDPANLPSGLQPLEPWELELLTQKIG
ncbi:hypothetical protein [Pedococcus soli]